MAFEGQAERRDLARGYVRARLDCGTCGQLLDRLLVDLADPKHEARSIPPTNPQRRQFVVDDGRRLHAVVTADGTRTDVRPRPEPGYLHRYRCHPGSDWQFRSSRLGQAIIAKAAASGRRNVRIVAGVDV
jgi:hypothetical protein